MDTTNKSTTRTNNSSSHTMTNDDDNDDTINDPNNNKNNNTDTVNIVPSMFVDESTECAICLGQFNDNNNDNEEKVIILECGHKWHLHCIIKQIQQLKINYTCRLLFNGCKCAKCGLYCMNHPELQNIINNTTTTDTIRNKVDNLIKEQIQIDGLRQAANERIAIGIL